MSRPKKCRNVCQMPKYKEFVPTDNKNSKNIVTLTVDEYETIRLIDRENFSQEECSIYMNVARTTVQQMYTDARKKLAIAVCDGAILKIDGGDFKICDEKTRVCCKNCMRHRCYRHIEEYGREEKFMKIAIPLDENKKDVCVSFARAPFFMIYDDENKNMEIVENPAAEAESGAGLKAVQFVLDSGANTVITVRCGENAGDAFKAADIKIYKSEPKDAMENIELLKENKLNILTKFHAGYHGIR